MAKLRVLIADVEGITRTGLRLLLEAQPDVGEVAEVDDGPGLLERVMDFEPDVLVIDVSRPGSRGIAAVRAVRHAVPGVRILALSAQAEDFLPNALRAGASGYLLIEADPEELQFAIRAVARGQCFISPAVTRSVIKTYLRYHGTDGEERDRYLDLTSREQEILQMAARGRTNRETAHSLHISVKTVEKHRASMMEKLGLHGSREMKQYAAVRGLLGALA